LYWDRIGSRWCRRSGSDWVVILHAPSTGVVVVVGGGGGVVVRTRTTRQPRGPTPVHFVDVFGGRTYIPVSTGMCFGSVPCQMRRYREIDDFPTGKEEKFCGWGDEGRAEAGSG
jgi:hypothetical protein